MERTGKALTGIFCSLALLVAFFLEIFPGIASAGPPDIWFQRAAPVLIGNCLESVTFGKSLFVAVGASGTIETSSNGATWLPQSAATNFSLKSVTFY